MARKRLTQVFPFLISLRVWQRKRCFYLKMRMDGRKYARERGDLLPYIGFEARSRMLNPATGADMTYQQNKIHNLKLAARMLNGVAIRPGETFSFWQLVRHADREEPYRDALTLRDGAIVPEYGGGLCQHSNLLYWMFLHSPLSIVERHAHGIKAFPLPDPEIPEGVDATVGEGWLDLKAANETGQPIQIEIEFMGEYVYGRIRLAEPPKYRLEVFTRSLRYTRLGEGVQQTVDVYRRRVDVRTGLWREEFLYHNRCLVGYPLPPQVPILEGP